MDLKSIKKEIEECKKCGKDWGNSAIGFGETCSPLIFFVGLNPKVEEHAFKDGRGITVLKQKLKEINFTDFYFDNIIKCDIPRKDAMHTGVVINCWPYLRKQLHLIKPKTIVVFGYYASRHLVGKFKAWEKVGERDGTEIYTLPHFSSFLYPGNKLTEEEYYNKFMEVLNEIRKRDKSRRIMEEGIDNETGRKDTRQLSLPL